MHNHFSFSLVIIKIIDINSVTALKPKNNPPVSRNRHRPESLISPLQRVEVKTRQILILLPPQTLGELFRVLTGKVKREPGLSRMAIVAWADSFIIGDSSWSAFQAAMDLAVDHRFQVWDALIMAVAAENHCRLLLRALVQFNEMASFYMRVVIDVLKRSVLRNYLKIMNQAQ